MPILVLIHVVISLLALIFGLLWLVSAVRGNPVPRIINTYLVLTLLTVSTAFLIREQEFTPAQGFGFLTLGMLCISFFALYGENLTGNWRTTFIIANQFTLYLNAFVLVVQAFQKLAPINRLDPSGAGPYFALAQSVTLVAFVVTGWLAIRSSRSMKRDEISIDPAR